MSPFPEIIKTRINGRKVTRSVRGDFVVIRVVWEDFPNVIWVHWRRRAKRELSDATLQVNATQLMPNFRIIVTREGR